jgi:acetyl-CoA acetyltransferase family protein
MAVAVIVDAVRTPIGRRHGALASWHPVDLTAHVLRAVVDRAAVDPALLDDVVAGCVSQVGEQAFNLGRNAALAAGLPDTVAGVTVDRQCGSSQQAVHFAAQGVIAGAYDLVIAAGVEHMSRVPMGESVVAAGSLPFRHAAGDPFGTALHARYPGLVPQGVAAERLAERAGHTRDALDAYAWRSHRRAAGAVADRRFARSIVAVPHRTVGAAGTETTGVLEHDELPRASITLDDLAGYAPVYQPGGVVTAANSAPVADGAAAVLIASEECAGRHGLPVLAHLRSFAVAGCDPLEVFGATVPATRRALERAKVRLDEIDAAEVHESFATAVLAWADAVGADPERTNVNGGAIALGHPLGASGARTLVDLVHELGRRDGRLGLQVMSEAGGTANALVIERS